MRDTAAALMATGPLDNFPRSLMEKSFTTVTIITSDNYDD